MDKRFLIILAVVVLGFFAFLILRPDSGEDVTAEPTNHVRGTGEILLVEYGDFQCPACYSYKPTIDEVMAKYDGKVKLQFRHLPLSSIHPHAVAAARAAEAAGKQDKFWEMYEKLYDTQGWMSWSQDANANASSIFRGYAEQLGLNMEQYDTDVNGPEVMASINADRAEAERLGFTGTPSFLLNGEVFTPEANSADAFSKKIDELLAQ